MCLLMTSIISCSIMSGKLRSQVRVTDSFVNCETSYTYHPLRGRIEQVIATLKELVCVCFEGRISMEKWIRSCVVIYWSISQY